MTKKINKFRKLRFSSFVLKQRSEAKFIKAFVAKFGKPHRTTVFLGDWSQGAARFHAPCKTKGYRTMFERANFDVFLVDEYRTSSVCPDCQTRNLKPFKKRRSPRPWRRYSTALVHGLLRCNNERCNEWSWPHDDRTRRRLWNRDDVATLNIERIAYFTLLHHEHLGRPAIFKRL